ncbi:MAG: hypothetical protein ACD_47C00568G0002 [uncultured bacterium]|nr:MAG: hypothetical protein ACD_47C00568G0002 [uncultured bacterium]
MPQLPCSKHFSECHTKSALAMILPSISALFLSMYAQSAPETSPMLFNTPSSSLSIFAALNSRSEMRLTHSRSVSRWRRSVSLRLRSVISRIMHTVWSRPPILKADIDISTGNSSLFLLTTLSSNALPSSIFIAEDIKKSTSGRKTASYLGEATRW